MHEYEVSCAPLLTVGEVAEMLHMKPGTIRSWVFYKKIPFLKIGGKVLFEADAIRDFRANCNVAVAK